MPTTTSRMGLTKPDPGEIQDITQLNTNADKLDLYNGLHICTSGTRPAAPWSGLVIYETDTQARLFWDGSAWRVIYKLTTGWNPVVKGTSSDPGNTSAAGWWAQVDKLVTVAFRIQNSTAGNGNYYVQAPIAAVDLDLSIGLLKMRQPGGQTYSGILQVNASDGTRLQFFTPAATDAVSHINPVVWASGAIFSAVATYRIA